MECVLADLLGSAWASGVRVGLCLRGPCELCGRAEHRAAAAGRAGTAVPVGAGAGAAQGQGQPGRARREGMGHGCDGPDGYRFASCRMRAYSVVADCVCCTC